MKPHGPQIDKVRFYFPCDAVCSLQLKPGREINTNVRIFFSKISVKTAAFY